MTVLLVFLATLIGFTALGVPIGFAIGLTSIVVMFVLGMPEPMVLARRLVSGIDIYTLLAIPFFMVAGEVMNRAGLVEDILRFARVLVGKVRGGLAHVNVVASMLFAGVQGSAVADTAALGVLEIEMMRKAGYDLPFSVAMTCASAIIGPIIPPSIPMIIMGSISQISVARLFLGGAVPGVLFGLALMGYVAYVARRRGYPVGARPTLREFAVAFRRAVWALILPAIILGGILLGVFTPTEAGAVAAVYAVLIAFLVYRLQWRAIPEIFFRAALNTGVVMLVCGAAMTLTWYLAVAQVPQQIAAFFSAITQNRNVFLLILNVVLFLVGMVLDLTPALFLLVPILYPVALGYGIDPIHFGVVMVTNLCVGLITPPVGTVLYVAQTVSKIKLEALVRELLPIYAVLFAVVLLITYLPQLVLWLPSLL